MTTPTNQLRLEPNSLDGVLFVMAYHDLYWTPKGTTAPLGNPAQVNADLFRAVKPGGVIVVVDHVASPGKDSMEVAQTIHRIDPQVVKNDFVKAGFMFDGESTVLHNAEDDHTKRVGDALIRYRTDRFIFRFRKPIKE
jgi:predicted methyltransferase